MVTRTSPGSAFISLIHAARVAACVIAIGPWIGGLARADALAIPGTGACEAILTELAKGYGSDRVSVPPSTGSGGGIKAVRSGQATLARVSRVLTDAERADGLVYRPFARDAAVFVAGASTQVKQLTSAQVRDIFNGQLVRWNQVGGIDAPIRVVTREPSDAAATVLRRAFPAFAEAQSFDGAKLATRDKENIELLLRYRTAIGFTANGELRDIRDRLAVVQVDGVTADADALRSGRYPAILEYAFVWKGRPTPEAERFMQFVASPAGQAILAQAGLAAARN